MSALCRSMLFPLISDKKKVDFVRSENEKWITELRAATAIDSWRRHQMETFSTLLALCEGNPLVNGGFPSQRPMPRSFNVFFDLRLKKWLNRQSRCRWFEKPSRSLWYHCNADSTWLIIHVNETNVIMMQLVFDLVRNAIQNISIWLSWRSLCTRKTGQGTGQVTDSVFPLRQLMLAPWP